MDNKYIKELSLKDKKTLSQKALKTCEEVGELAKAILPFDSAPGTNHRFIDKEKILEEIADVYLTNISIAYSLNFEDSEIEEMIYRKALKWGEIQSKEEKATFPLPFEIHVTINATEMKDVVMCDSKPFDIDHFKNACKEIGVKPIVLDLEILNGLDITDIMTSSKHIGDNRSAYEECQRISSDLKKWGFIVLREKIESIPWHPAAPVLSKRMPKGCYFESHIGVSIFPSEKEKLNQFVTELPELIDLQGKAKLSQNFFKKSKDGSRFINILTYRNDISGSPAFKLEVEGIKHLLTESGFDYEKVEVEYAIYDTNVLHDSLWINQLSKINE